MSALAIGASAVRGLPESTARRRPQVSKGVEHRLEFVAEINGVKFYNDSKRPMWTRLTMYRGLRPRCVNVILGGKGQRR